MNELAEHGIFLGWSAYDRERPDGIGPMEYLIDAQYRMGMCEAVVTEMIAKRALREKPLGHDGAGDAKVGVGMDGKALWAAYHAYPAPAERPGKAKFAHPFG